MALTLIDGVLCCPKSEFDHLCTIRGLKQYALANGRKYVSEREAVEQYGAKPRTYSGAGFSYGRSVWGYAPDEWVIQEAYKAIQPANDSTYAQIGEENINGEVWSGPDPGCTYYWTDGDGKRHFNTFADLSFVGPASLGGKIVLELCRRLAAEVCKDAAAQSLYVRRYLPDAPPHIQQPPTAAEDE